MRSELVVPAAFFLITCVGSAASLSGMVINAKTGEPIADASVELIPSKDPPGIPHAGYIYVHGAKKQITTDDGGRFHFQNVAPGVYRVSATADDYCEPEILVNDLYRFDTPFGVRAGVHLPDAILRLSHCVEIRGRVTTPDGTPLPNVKVYLHPVDPGHEGSEDTTTDALGQYEFTDLWDGEYVMEAVPPIRLGKHPAALPVTTYPTHLRVEYGDILIDMNLVIKPLPARKLTVRLVADREIDPLELDLEIRSILWEPMETVQSVSAHSTGPQVIDLDGLAPGRYFIEKQTRIGDFPLAGGKLVDIGPAEDVSVELPLLPLVKVFYTGRRLDGRPLPKGICVAPSDVQVHRGSFPSACPAGDVVSQIDLPGDVTYRMTLVHEGLYLDSVLINGHRQDASDFQFPAGAREVKMELIFGTSAKILVEPAKGMDVSEINAAVVLFDVNGIATNLIGASLDNNRLKIDGIPPGRHRLLVWTGDTSPCDLKNVSSCSGSGEWVSLKSGQLLTLIPGPQVR